MVFPIPFAYFRFVCHILVMLAIFQPFSIIIIFFMMIYNLWCYSCHCFEGPQLHMCNMANLINVCVLIGPQTDHFPSSPCLLRHHCFLEHTILRLGLLITLWYPTKCSSEKRGPPMSLTLNQKLEMITEKEMATHSSVLAWRIPGTEEPGGLPSMGSHRVKHDWSDLAAAAAEMIKLSEGAML